jgi:radical SAM superfamily enzyme YgiQ (UPF0313 family)
MKLTLITPTPPDTSAFGVRSISAFLRSKGRQVRLIFLPGSIGLLREEGEFIYSYPKNILTQIVDLCRDSDLIGVSFMTNYFDRAIQITKEIKQNLDAPVIWGGMHPSTKPEEALQFADMVCIGEGEDSLLDLLDRMEQGMDYRGVEGIWFRSNGDVIKNPLRPLISDLDALPHFDFSNVDHYILNKDANRIDPVDDFLFENTMPFLPDRNGRLKRVYRTMTDRGCPHRCSYCNVSTLKEMYRNDKSSYLRARSATNVVEELVRIRRRFPFIEAIQFFDDTFFARSSDHLAQFAELYKERVGLPFYCQASPNTLTEKKLQLLLDAGLIYVEMGIQTGSAAIRELYRRTESNEKILAAAKLLNAYSHRLIPPDYHVIIDNPWETMEDSLATVKLLYEIPKPYGLCISSLVFFPGTALYVKAHEDGIIRDELVDIYRRPFYVPPKSTYVNFLIYLCTFQHFPKPLLAALMNEALVKRLSGIQAPAVYKTLYGLGEAVRLFFKGVKALSRGDWQRISLFFRSLRLKDPVVAGRKN